MTETLVRHVTECFYAWLEGQDEGWRDDAGDPCEIESSLAEAFAAGYARCLDDQEEA